MLSHAAYLPGVKHGQQVIGVLLYHKALPEVDDEVFPAGKA